MFSRLSCFCCSVLCGLLSFGAQALQAQTKPIPEYILYKHFFDHVAAFRMQADSLDFGGSDGNALRYYFQDRLGLTLRESEQLQAVALEYATAMRANRETVRQTVEQFRALYFPGNILPLGTEPPPPPAELHQLNEQRKQIVSAARTQLQTLVSPDTLAAIDAYVHSTVAANTTEDRKP